MRDLRRASVISMRSLFGTTPAAELSFSSSRLRILPAIASLICSSLLLPAASKQCRKSLHPCTHQRTHARTHAQTRIHATPPGRILFQFRARKCPGVGQRHHGTEDNSQSTHARMHARTHARTQARARPDATHTCRPDLRLWRWPSMALTLDSSSPRLVSGLQHDLHARDGKVSNEARG